MPPSKHSGSSKSAHKDSDQIPSDQNYTLGDYSFRIERTSVPSSTNDKIEAICTDKDGHNARKSIQVPSSTKVDGWYVEANETEATVYALVEIPVGDSGHTSSLDTGDWTQPVAESSYGRIIYDTGVVSTEVFIGGIGTIGRYKKTNQGLHYIAASDERDGSYLDIITYNGQGEITGQTRTYARNEYTANGKTVYYATGAAYPPMNNTIEGGQIINGPNYSSGAVAWTLIYGDTVPSEYEEKEILVGRFAIEIEDAGGVGPDGGVDGGWTDPEDYDEDWEEGDPTHTLFVTVTGALSGRHNDPIVDSSYSYIPADKDTVKDYGCGGDGGHGGGGGAGASTVVVHKFATNQANSKEVTAIARRHGYGSGGGKGGKGGDGCILVYY